MADDRRTFLAWQGLLALAFVAALVLAANCDLVPAHAAEVKLKFTAVGDDSLIGTATRYDLRWTATPPGADLDAWWTSAFLYATPAPKVSGQPETLTVRGFAPGGTYWFAIRAWDDANNPARAISNVLAATTPDSVVTPPDTATVPYIRAEP